MKHLSAKYRIGAVLSGGPQVKTATEGIQYKRMIAAFGCAILLGVAASVKVPLPWTPVPITLQTFVLYAGAALLGRHFAVQMVFWYLGLGLMGWPLFAGGASGLGALVGPTGGYLIGFLAAAAWIGYLQGQVRGFWSQILLFYGASFVLFLCGASWLAITMNLGLKQTVMAGVVPFIPGDLLKILLATFAVGVWRKISH